MSDDRFLATARQIADDVLFPRSLEADLAGVVPEEQLQCLADAGFYGASTGDHAASIPMLVEILASGCLTTAFVWAQHQGAAVAAQTSTLPVHDAWAGRLRTGEARGGVAFAHMLRPGDPLTKALPDADGWRFTGAAPWVTGWGHVDVVHAGARHGDDIVWALIDGQESATLSAKRLDLAAVHSTQTVVLLFDGHHVPADRVTRVDNYEEWRAKYQLGLRTNGSFPLGVARRCCALLDDPAFTARLDALRTDLDVATVETMAPARAAAALFAVQVATALVATTGGRAVTMEEHAQRLLREAMFLLVQGQTPAIRAEMLTSLRP